MTNSADRSTSDVAAGLEVLTLGVAAGPAIRGAENGMATAIVVDGVWYMVDFGLGCTRAAHEAGLRGQDFRAGFVTHLHSDHVAEIPAFLLWNWGEPVQGFAQRIQIHGPGQDDEPSLASLDLKGTEGMLGAICDAFSYDIHIRVEDEGRPALEDLVEVHDLDVPQRGSADPFVVYEDDRVTVTAVLVDHPPVFPAVAYRFDTQYGSVVISGDTAECQALAHLASGADLLIHEAVNLEFYRQRGFNASFIAHQENSHTSPAGAGRIARTAEVRHLVLSHLAGQASPEFWEDGARSTFEGPVTVATSGQRFTISQRHAHPVP